MKDQAFISVVVLISKSDQNTRKTLLNLDAFFNKLFESYEFVIVNNTPATAPLLNESLPALQGKVSVINLAWRHNPELAMLAGTELAIGDFLYEIDLLELDYPLDILLEIYRKSLEGYDIVSATPTEQIPLSSRLFYKLLNKVAYTKLDLITETARIVSRRALNTILKKPEKTRYRKALYKYSGFPTTTLPYKPLSKIRKQNRKLLDGFHLASDVLVSFSALGLTIAIFLSLMCLLVSVCLGVYAITIYLTLHTVVTGWTTTMLFLSFGFSGLFLVLALVIKYISIILTEVQDRPHYTTRSIEKL